MNTLKGNVERAREQRGKPRPALKEEGTEESEENENEYCAIEWGSDVSQLLLSIMCLTCPHLIFCVSSSQFLPKNDGPGFDTVIVSDLLHFDSSHAASPPNLVNLEFTSPPVITPNKTSVTVS